MKNITITLPESTARWVRIWAAKQGKSVSAALASLLEEKKSERGDRKRAWAEFIGDGPAKLSARKYPKRDELYER